ncbi:Protein of unknown function [Gryllus bimaculatus]|nr:Protein of unknown function [Gryllus bimaculatus]
MVLSPVPKASLDMSFRTVIGLFPKEDITASNLLMKCISPRTCTLYRDAVYAIWHWVRSGVPGNGCDFEVVGIFHETVQL